jgi:hypothetical protein
VRKKSAEKNAPLRKSLAHCSVGCAKFWELASLRQPKIFMRVLGRKAGIFKGDQKSPKLEDNHDMGRTPHIAGPFFEIPEPFEYTESENTGIEASAK